MTHDFESRLRTLEQWMGGVTRRLGNDEADIATLKGLALAMRSMPQLSAGGGPGQILWAYCGSGISAASVTGSAGAFTLAPAPNACDLYTYNAGANNWQFFGTATVYNDWPNSSGAGVAAGHWCLVYQDAAGKYRVLGEQC